MVAHRAVTRSADRCVIEILLQEPEIGAPILIGRENFAPVPTSLGNVAAQLRQHTSVSPWHGHDCTEKSRSSGCPLCLFLEPAPSTKFGKARVHSFGAPFEQPCGAVFYKLILCWHEAINGLFVFL
jgi:hypothetical protein